ncbi:hypothetical protein DPMN_117663 [Dreissena polymorpha]|uniref:Uncharacterized protein n=1 Tax=Dreissena polymorpha TaxID=45954 RepID=A0A9D4JMT4_DREPO|nr:hypothetical protein DPMN_117663 [Dreissena polymorpha]
MFATSERRWNEATMYFNEGRKRTITTSEAWLGYGGVTGGYNVGCVRGGYNRGGGGGRGVIMWVRGGYNGGMLKKNWEGGGGYNMFKKSFFFGRGYNRGFWGRGGVGGLEGVGGGGNNGGGGGGGMFKKNGLTLT